MKKLPVVLTDFIANDWSAKRRVWVPSVVLLIALLTVKPLGLTWLHLPVAIALLAVPGYLLTRLMGLFASPPVERLALSAVAGIFWLCGVGVLSTMLLPLFGVERPLGATPLMGVYSAALGMITLFAMRRPDIVRKPVAALNGVSICMYIVAVALPVMSFIGASLLNNGRSNALLIIMFLTTVAAIITAVVRSRDLHPSVFPALLFSISLSAVWTYALRSGFVYGQDIQQEFMAFQTTHAGGVWRVGGMYGTYNAMLSLTVFPTVLSNLSGLSGGVLFKVFCPMLCSLLPVVLYYVYRLFVRRWVAFAAAALTVVQLYYVQEFATHIRQQFAFLFFAVLLYALLNKTWSATTRHWFLGIGIGGLIVSHHATAFITVVFLSVVYVGTKVVQLAVRQDLSFKRIVRRDVFLPWWVVPALVVGMILWYGPVTQSNKIAVSILRPSAYAAFIDKTVAYLQRDVVFAVKTEHPEPTVENYLLTVGEDYRAYIPQLNYYALASNGGLQEKKTTDIPAAPLLYPVSTGVDTAMRIGWWLLAFGGAVTLLLRAWRKRTARHIQLGLLVIAPPVLCMVGHFVPQAVHLYDVYRMNEYMLLIGALPAVAFAAWLFVRIMPVWHKLVIGGMLSVSLLFASGVVTQMVGGVPTANLNNYGRDYQRFYQTQADKAAAVWLGDNRQQRDIVFADRYAGLRLITETDVTHNVFPDVTPETLDISAFIYANRTNVIDKTTMASYQDTPVQFTFPEDFLMNRKNLLYSNGQAEIYR